MVNSVGLATFCTRTREYDSANVKVKPHSDRVSSNEDVKSSVGVVKEFCLPSTRFWRETSVNDAAFQIGRPLDIMFQTEQVLPAKRNQSVSPLQIG